MFIEKCNANFIVNIAKRAEANFKEAQTSCMNADNLLEVGHLLENYSIS